MSKSIKKVMGLCVVSFLFFACGAGPTPVAQVSTETSAPAGWKGVAGSPPDSQLNVSWYYNWGYGSSHFSDPKFVPMVRPGADLNMVADLAAQYPGRYWMILNEPDVDGQDELTPYDAAYYYALYYSTIKNADDSAKVGGINLTYIEADGSTTGYYLYYFLYYLALYYPSSHIDFYCVHAWGNTDTIQGGRRPFIDGGDPDDRSKDKPTWGDMEDHLEYIQGFDELAGKPIWVTESGGANGTYGYTDPFDPARSARIRDNYQIRMLDWLYKTGFGLGIERVAWFSTLCGMPPSYGEPWRYDSLYKDETYSELSPLGEYYAGVTNRRATATSSTALIYNFLRDIAGCSLTLDPGTYLISGVFDFAGNNNGAVAIGVLDVGGVPQYGGALFEPGSSGYWNRATVTQTWRVVLGSTTTVKLQAYKDANVGAFIAWKYHTSITAVKESDSARAPASAALELTHDEYQEVPNCNLTLGAGTWVVSGVFDFKGWYNGSYAYAIGMLDVGGVIESSAAAFQPGGTGYWNWATVTQTWRITLGSPTTVKLRAYKTAGYFVTSAYSTSIAAVKVADSARNAASGDVVLKTYWQNVPGCSLTLGAGTWVVSGVFDIAGWSNGSVAVGALGLGGGKLQLGKTNFRPGSTGYWNLATVTQTWRITLGSPTTVKLIARETVSTNSFIVYNTNSSITAVKVE